MPSSSKLIQPTQHAINAQSLPIAIQHYRREILNYLISSKLSWIMLTEGKKSSLILTLGSSMWVYIRWPWADLSRSTTSPWTAPAVTWQTLNGPVTHGILSLQIGTHHLYKKTTSIPTRQNQSTSLDDANTDSLHSLSYKVKDAYMIKLILLYQWSKNGRISIVQQRVHSYFIVLYKNGVGLTGGAPRPTLSGGGFGRGFEGNWI